MAKSAPESDPEGAAMRGFRSAAAWIAAFAVGLAPTVGAAGEKPVLAKEGFWSVGVGDGIDAGRCIASVPVKAGGMFILMADQGQVTFGFVARGQLRQGRQGLFETEAYSFDFAPTFGKEGDVLYFDDVMNKNALAALRLAKAIRVSVDRRVVLAVDVENTGLEAALDAVIDCSKGQRGWWGKGAPLTQASNDRKREAAPAGASGSAFFISADGVAVTAAHVVKGCGRLESPRWGVVKVLAADPRADLAILKAPGASGQYVPLRARGPRLGENMSAAGYPLGQLLGPGLKITTGVVSGLSGPQGDRGLFQLSAPIQPGNSGGPVIDADGALIGVVAAKLDELKLADATGVFPQNINFAVPVTILQSFLDENGVAYKTASAGMTAATAAMPGYTFAVVCTR
jgi:S1-C subfamily serine protease